MKFTKYSNIENSYREKEIQRIIESGFASEDIVWVVTEKIHGTNLSFLSDGNEVKVAKRTSILSEDGLAKFYDADKMNEKYKENIRKLARYITFIYEANEIQVFGEHFGGIYNSETEKGYTKIQKEVQYIPYTDFMIFDILVKFKNKEVFMNWDRIKELATKYRLKVVPELFRGNFEECLQYSNEFETVIPEYYGIQDFYGKVKNNICEGVVIKPLKDLRFSDGSRVILKNKNEKFKEKGKVKKPKSAKNINLSDENKKWVDEISRYFEVNRINAVLSKGEVELGWKQFGKLAGLFFKDALDDFIKDNPDYVKLSKESKRIIQRYALVRAQNFIRDFLKKHI